MTMEIWAVGTVLRELLATVTRTRRSGVLRLICDNLPSWRRGQNGSPCLDELSETNWFDLDSWLGIGSTKVTSVVPKGFASYVRVLHPASGPSTLVPWSEVARTTGRTMHPLAQWDRISPAGDWETRWDSPPQGAPPLELLTELVSTLQPFTPAAGDCFFAIWDGWGQLHRDSIASATSGSAGEPSDTATSLSQFVSDREVEAQSYPRFELEPGSGRRYLLDTGALAMVLEISDCSVFEHPGVPVATWWPKDHSWFVASDIDFDSTLIGGTQEICHKLLGKEQLEALEIPPDGVLSEDGDTINPPPH